MNKTVECALSVTCLALCVASCSVANDDPAVVHEQPETPDPETPDLAMLLLRAACAYYERCSEEYGKEYESIDACVARRPAELGLCEAPHVSASAAKVEGCVAFMEQFECGSIEPLLAPDNPCQGVQFEGLAPSFFVPQGAQCAGLWECVSTSYCAVPLASDPPNSCAVCRPIKSIGDTCIGDFAHLLECGLQAECDPETLRCAAKAQLGVGELCDSDDACASDWCQEGTGTCRKQLERNDACAAGDSCQGSLRCLNGICTDRRGLDSPCSSSKDCLSGLVCGSSHACVEPATCGAGQLDDQCIDGGCAAGLYCFVDRCRQQEAFGEYCIADDECAAGLKCGPITDKCEPVGYVCDSERCVAIGGDGYLCDLSFAGRDCQSSYCDPTTSRCAQPPACVMP